MGRPLQPRRHSMPAEGGEIIIVRSLADSDMGLFSAHRAAATSKQRAIALTTRMARELLSSTLFAGGGAEMDCICLFGSVTNRESRHIGKVGKNWRLGGSQIVGAEFAALDSKDFALIRSVRYNDGTSPIMITFVGRHAQRFIQAGLAAALAEKLDQSVAIFGEDSDIFDELAEIFPPIPARVAIRRAVLQTAFL